MAGVRRHADQVRERRTIKDQPSIDVDVADDVERILELVLQALGLVGGHADPAEGLDDLAEVAGPGQGDDDAAAGFHDAGQLGGLAGRKRDDGDVDDGVVEGEASSAVGHKAPGVATAAGHEPHGVPRQVHAGGDAVT